MITLQMGCQIRVARWKPTRDIHRDNPIICRKPQHLPAPDPDPRRCLPPPPRGAAIGALETTLDTTPSRTLLAMPDAVLSLCSNVAPNVACATSRNNGGRMPRIMSNAAATLMGHCNGPGKNLAKTPMPAACIATIAVFVSPASEPWRRPELSSRGTQRGNARGDAATVLGQRRPSWLLAT